MREMKDCGIEWEKQVPANWTNDTIRNLLIARDGGAWGNEPSEDDEGVICLRIADFDYDKGKFADKPIEDLTRRSYKSTQIQKLLLQENDICIEKSGGGEKTPVGRAVLFDKDYPALFANFMERLRFDTTKVYPIFVEYWLRTWYASKGSPYYINQTTGIQNINLSLMIAKERLFFPSVDEQHRISTYLDAKCSEIDALTADIQTQIDTLEQYKRSVITEAVTKGLNRDVEMKESGIEYVGKIPASWDMHPVYYYFGERKHKNSLGEEQNLLSLSYGNIIRKDINTREGLLPESFNTYNIVEAGDIIIRPTDLQNDKRSLRTGLVREHGIITSAYIDLMPVRNINTEYYHYLLHAFDVMKVFYNMGNGVRQGLNFSEFSRLMVFEPSLAEQNSIVDYLNDKCGQINTVISEKQDQLATLDAYKKSTIYEYVTGKKEVPAV